MRRHSKPKNVSEWNLPPGGEHEARTGPDSLGVGVPERIENGGGSGGRVTPVAGRDCLVEPATGQTLTYAELMDRVERWGPRENPHPLACGTGDVGEGMADFLTQFLGSVLRGVAVILPPAWEGIRDEHSEETRPGEGEAPPLIAPLSRQPGALARALRKAGRTPVTLHTSGSAGRPKRVVQTLDALTRAVRRGPTHEDAVWALAYHPCHLAGLQVLFQALMNDNTLVILTTTPPGKILAAMETHGVTHISATPTFYRVLPPVRKSLDAVRRVTFGGEAFDPVLERRMRAVFPRASFLNIYASTEAGPLLATRGDRFSVPPELEDRIRIVDGQLEIHRSLTGRLINGYETEQAGPWYRTGDAVEAAPSRDEGLRFRFLPRQGRIINIGGMLVEPREVESVLREHECVIECEVYARPSSVLGCILSCDAVLGQPVEERMLRQYLAARLPDHQVPRVWRFRDRLETSGTGKRPLRKHA